MKTLLTKNTTKNVLLAETDSSLIRAELERLLSDRRFSGARQMSAFLRYIVSETLDGNGNRIKAYTVGVDALGKADDFDAQSDPSVRVLALRLRKSLEAAYANEPECHARIVMNVGSYVPKFYKPTDFLSGGDEEQGSAVSATNSVSGLEANRLPMQSNAANRRLVDIHERTVDSRYTSESRPAATKINSSNLNVARMESSSILDSVAAPEKWLVITIVSLAAVAWQASISAVGVLPW
ncbi:hypothetical protein [Granulosicoccus antarcticus]|uniref:Uncharacterized protein n=1 Tax=Granulosicoccus antarcticus IMCC3135 TaxID=1192854 RepID=A0A2Z2NMW0_9GAMM|nr:hypothetical protein [Granulosicoccus antarcticus]ASJ72559.1 hypothetical protein IMCC3135_12355 [Granulosicoccus antarcticus IMCC3135]